MLTSRLVFWEKGTRPDGKHFVLRLSFTTRQLIRFFPFSSRTRKHDEYVPACKPTDLWNSKKIVWIGFTRYRRRALTILYFYEWLLLLVSISFYVLMIVIIITVIIKSPAAHFLCYIPFANRTPRFSTRYFNLNTITDL